MASILFPISVIVGLILAVGLMSLSETALARARGWRLRVRAAQGERGAAAALRLTGHLERFVATVRVGSALAGSLAEFAPVIGCARGLARRPAIP